MTCESCKKPKCEYCTPEQPCYHATGDCKDRDHLHCHGRELCPDCTEEKQCHWHVTCIYPDGHPGACHSSKPKEEKPKCENCGKIICGNLKSCKEPYNENLLACHGHMPTKEAGKPCDEKDNCLDCHATKPKRENDDRPTPCPYCPTTTTKGSWTEHAGYLHFAECAFPTVDQAVCNCPKMVATKNAKAFLHQVSASSYEEGRKDMLDELTLDGKIR